MGTASAAAAAVADVTEEGDGSRGFSCWSHAFCNITSGPSTCPISNVPPFGTIPAAAAAARVRCSAAAAVGSRCSRKLYTWWNGKSCTCCKTTVTSSGRGYSLSWRFCADGHSGAAEPRTEVGLRDGWGLGEWCAKW